MSIWRVVPTTNQLAHAVIKCNLPELKRMRNAVLYYAPADVGRRRVREEG